MATAILLVLVAVGSVVFHFLSPWWWTPIASNWAYIDHTIIITFWITGVVFVAVVLFTAYCVYRFRHRPGNAAHYEPESKRLEMWLTVVTGIGVAAMLAPGLYVWHQFVTVPADATEIEVVGRQWSWAYRLPGKDGRLGTSDTRNVSPDNPLGVNANDPNGKDDVVIDGDDLHLPIGKPVKVLLRTFDVLCAELCGVGHPAMRGKVIVEEEGKYQAWLEKQQTFAELTGSSKPVKASYNLETKK